MNDRRQHAQEGEGDQEGVECADRHASAEAQAAEMVSQVHGAIIGRCDAGTRGAADRIVEPSVLSQARPLLS